MALRRRDWLQLAAAQAVCTSVHTRAFAQQPVVFDIDPFQLGIASGQPTSNSVVLWTRLISSNPVRNPWKDVEVPVQWELATDPAFEKTLRSGATTAPPDLSHSVHLEVVNLPANQVLWYRFRAGQFVSPVGRTRTLPAPDDATTPLKVAFASCQRYHSGAFLAYDHMLADAPDLVVFLGDYIYEMGATQNENRGTWMYPATKITDYRELYELAKSDPSLQRMHAACPWLIIWDDHEVHNDYAGGPTRLLGQGGKTARHMIMGYRTWYEHMPISPRALIGGSQGLFNNSHELRIYGSHQWGKLVNFHLLDTRQYRSPQANCGVAGLFKPEGCAELPKPEREMLGPAQTDWLQKQFTAQTKHAPTRVVWNLICQPSVFSKFIIPLTGGVLNHDNWDGYPAAREKILADLERTQTSNPVFLGGDIHQNWVAQIHRDPDDTQSAPIAPEFCSTSVTTASFGSFTGAEMKALAPHCVYADRHKRGYMLAMFNAEKMTMSIRQVDISANTVQTAARFEVNAGSPLVRQIA